LDILEETGLMNSVDTSMDPNAKLQPS